MSAKDGYAGTLPVPPAPEKPKSAGDPGNPKVNGWKRTGKWLLNGT